MNFTLIEKPTLDSLQSEIFQNIIYFMQDSKKTIEIEQCVYVDFLCAMSELEKLDWTFEKNYIGFKNLNTEDTVQFMRLKEDYWYVDVPIKNNGSWEGYFWFSHDNSREISEMLKLFFQETDWFGMLTWKLERDVT
mgnify:CR=1 FL=1